MAFSVHSRFIMAVERLIKENIARNKKDISESLNVSPSYFSGILKGAIKINGDFIQQFIAKWQVNPAWMFGTSEVFYAADDQMMQEEVAEPAGQYLKPVAPDVRAETCKRCDEKDRLIAQQQITIQALQKALDHAERRLADNELKR